MIYNDIYTHPWPFSESKFNLKSDRDVSMMSSDPPYIDGNASYKTVPFKV